MAVPEACPWRTRRHGRRVRGLQSGFCAAAAGRNRGACAGWHRPGALHRARTLSDCGVAHVRAAAHCRSRIGILAGDGIEPQSGDETLVAMFWFASVGGSGRTPGLARLRRWNFLHHADRRGCHGVCLPGHLRRAASNQRIGRPTDA